MQILDGGIGRHLKKIGAPFGQPEWSALALIEEPSFVSQAHNDFINAGADFLTIHYEVDNHPIRTLEYIKSKGANAGIAINPATPESVIEYLLDYCDLILVMLVNPGFGGQKFMPEVLDKIKELKKIQTENNINFDIEIDGGINFENCQLAIESGANILVSGTTVFKSNDGDIKKNINLLKLK